MNALARDVIDSLKEENQTLKDTIKGLTALIAGYEKEVKDLNERIARSKRKVAKVTVGNNYDLYGKEIFHFIVKMDGRQFMINCKFGGRGYSSRKNAIRGARRFCKAIGYECEIVKEVK